MPQIEQIVELERALLEHIGNPTLGAQVQNDLNTARAELATDASAMVRYRAALAAAFTAAGEDLDDTLDEVAAAPVAFLGPVYSAARPLVESARLAGVDLDATIDLGPAEVGLSAPIATARPDPEAAASAGRATLGHLPVGHIGARLELGPINASAGGYLDPERMAAGAMLGADLGFARAEAALLLDGGDTLSVLALLRAEFRPTGVQLGLGFSLDAIGGIVGVNRTVDAGRMRTRIADGSALDALFGGGGGVAEARRAMAALADVFPPLSGSHVVGPTLRLGWLTVMGGSLARLDLGVVLVIPAGRVLIPGRIVIEVPGPGVPLLHLLLDVLGEADLPGQRLALDAALVDSQVMGTMTVSGTAAARLAWGSSSMVLATIGGFYPGFRPEPVAVPPQRRIGIALSNPVPAGLRISLEGYVATAAGTLQAGATASVALEVAGTGVSGSAGFDAIVQLAPLWFEARVVGSVSLRALGQRLAGVDLLGTMTGPGPMVLTVRATAEILGFDVGGTVSFTLSDRPGADRAPFDGIMGIVEQVLRDGSHVGAQGGGDTDVVLAPRPANDGVPLLAPGATLVWSQESFPLGDPFTKAAGRTLRRPAMVEVTTSGDTPHPVTRRLTAAAYTTISPADALSIPPFEDRRAGWSLERARTSGPHADVLTSHRTVRLPVLEPTSRVWRRLDGAALTVNINAAIRALDAPAAPAPGVPSAVAVHAEPWATSSARTDGHLSGAAAHAHASVIPGAFALPQAAAAPVALP